MFLNNFRDFLLSHTYIINKNLFNLLLVSVFPKFNNFLFSHKFQFVFFNMGDLIKFGDWNLISIILINFFNDFC
jgi:hypothetical protein